MDWSKREGMDEEERWFYDQGYQDGLKAVEKLGKWNLCKQEMPSYLGTYLVTLKEKYSFEKEWRYHVDVADAFGSEIDNFWDTFNDWIEGQEVHVIAWADFPEPYKQTT